MTALKAFEQKLCVYRSRVYEVLSSLASDNAQYFRGRRVAYGERIAHQCLQVTRHSRKLQRDIMDVSACAYKFDLDEATPGNGYRSMIAVVDTCLLHLIRLLGRITEQRSSMMFMAGHFCRELESYVSVLDVLRSGIMYAKKFMDSESGKLFPDDDNPELENMMDEVEALPQKCFYGRCMGFQFCSSMVRPFQIVGVGMAAYSEGFAFQPQGATTGIVRAAVSILSSSKYIMNPEKRAETIVKVTRHASIDFCKAFWNITETDFLRHLSQIQCPHSDVNQILQIPLLDSSTGSLYLARNSSADSDNTVAQQVEIPVPSCHTGLRPVQIRLISHNRREGMVAAPKASSTPNAAVLPKSSCLLLHCHGGGFVAQSSKSHEVYLTFWAKTLNVPIVSVDYSKAPENPYPRAQDEVLYTYAWLINNPHLVGWTGERIVLTGDSAGGNLAVTTTLRLIDLNVARLPTALVLTYTPFMVRYVPSPSRFLSLMDPLLPLGIIARCMAAYTGNTELFEDAWPESAQERQREDSSSASRRLRKKASSASSSSKDNGATISPSKSKQTSNNNKASIIAQKKQTPPDVIKAKACRTQNVDHVESQKSNSGSSDDGSSFVVNSEKVVDGSMECNARLLSYVRFTNPQRDCVNPRDFAAGCILGQQRNDEEVEQNASGAATAGLPTIELPLDAIPPLPISDKLSIDASSLSNAIVAEQDASNLTLACEAPVACSSPLPKISTPDIVFFSDEEERDLALQSEVAHRLNPEERNHHQRTSLSSLTDRLEQQQTHCGMNNSFSSAFSNLASLDISSASIAERRRTVSQTSNYSNQSDSSSIFGSLMTAAKTTVRAVASLMPFSAAASSESLLFSDSLRPSSSLSLHPLDRSFDASSTFDHRTTVGASLLEETEAQALELLQSPEDNVLEITPALDVTAAAERASDAEDAARAAAISSTTRTKRTLSAEGITTVQIQKDPAKICLSTNCDVRDTDELLRYLETRRDDRMRLIPSASADTFFTNSFRSSLETFDEEDAKLSSCCATDESMVVDFVQSKMAKVAPLARRVSKPVPSAGLHAKRALTASAAVSIQSNCSSDSSSDDDSSILVSNYVSRNVLPSSYFIDALAKVSSVLNGAWINRRDNPAAFSSRDGLAETVGRAKDGETYEVAQEAFASSQDSTDTQSNENSHLQQPSDQPGSSLDPNESLAPSLLSKQGTTSCSHGPLHRFHSSNMNVEKDPFLSPLYASSEMLAKLPPCYLIACHLDPLLDDSITFAKKLRQSGTKFVHVDLVDSLPHGFLNFTMVSRDCKMASKLIAQRIREAFANV